MLFIATATITRSSREPDSEPDEVYQASHIVEAPCEHSAAGMLYDHYEAESQKDQCEGPYYKATDIKAFPPIGLSSLRR